MNDKNLRGVTSDPGSPVIRGFDLVTALREFTILFQQENNDRAVAIIGPAFLDSLLEQVLTNFLIEDEREVSRLLSYDQPIGSFGNRTSMAYCLGLIEKTVRDDLRLVGKIRNRFAHRLDVTFETPPIRDWCLALKWHRLGTVREPPADATPRDYFQVGVNQLVCYLNGIVDFVRMSRRQKIDSF